MVIPWSNLSDGPAGPLEQLPILGRSALQILYHILEVLAFSLVGHV